MLVHFLDVATTVIATKTTCIRCQVLFSGFSTSVRSVDRHFSVSSLILASFAVLVTSLHLLLYSFLYSDFASKVSNDSFRLYFDLIV